MDPHFDMPSQPQRGLAPCPHCFESCGYVCEHGNDWNSGPWTNQTNIPCSVCEGTGHVPMEDATDDELFEHFDEAFDALTKRESA
jgi:hypothetical protein